MLKGKSTVQLFDAATGAKVLEQSNTNLVTNALDNIANLREKSGILKWMRERQNNVHEHCTVVPYIPMIPLYQRALGGILLWDENIKEDPSIVIPPAGVKEVGHAGDNYGGDDLYRGSYNGNESGKISGGYRHVWDFDTDKANGTIKCLSLTSCHGGNIGYHGCFSGDLYPRYNHFYFHSSNTYTVTDPSTFGINVTGDTTGAAIYLRTMEDGTLRLYKRNDTSVWYLKLPDPSVIGLFTSELVYTEKVVLPITLTNQYAAVYVYKGQIHEISEISTDQLQHRIFSLEGEQVSSRTVNLPYKFSSLYHYSPAIYRNGYYYCFFHNDTYITKLDEQGQEVGKINFLSASNDAVYSVTINEYNEEITFGIYLGSGVSVTAYMTYTLSAEDEIGKLNYSTSYPCSSHWKVTSSPPHPQYVKTDEPNSTFVFFNDPYYSRIVPLVNTGYLATINNLQTPITKTSAQTMKITYEIYDE